MPAPSDLLTDRLRVRPFREDDLEALHAVLSDPKAMRFYPRPFDREMTRRWIERWRASYEEAGLGMLAIEDRGTGEVIGDCGPSIQFVDGERFVELGWHVRADRQRHGIATEAGAACRDHLFATSDFGLLISLIRPENVPSWRVASKLGFRPWRGTVRAGMGHLVWRLDQPG